MTTGALKLKAPLLVLIDMLFIVGSLQMLP
jgi:hypothetical protein